MGSHVFSLSFSNRMKFASLLPIGVLCCCLIQSAESQSLNGSMDEGGIQSESPSSGEFRPNIQPSHTLAKATGVINIDGQLDDDGWDKILPLGNFSEIVPNDMTRPPVRLKAKMTYDQDYLYVAIVVYDDPELIRANLSDRDEIWQDDYAGVVLDPNRDGQGLYFIASNPLGIQGDIFITLNDEDEGFDLFYQSSGQITDDGYQVEFAIPFKSLRFPNVDVQAWGASLWVTRPRESRSQYSWAAISQDNPCMSCQLGEVRGIKGVKSGRNLEILPSLTGGGVGSLQDPNIPTSGFDQERITVDPSLNVKYGITSDLTADVTVNPDFSQIEADEAQIDVNSTFALFFAERRPFFQEGSGLFNTEIQTVYTRSINDPIAAAKLTGRFGPVDVAYIGARDNHSPLLLPFEEQSRLVQGGHSFSNILRVIQNFDNDSFIGALVTDRRLDEGGSGSTFSVDASARFLQKYRISGQMVYSHHHEPVDNDIDDQIGELYFGRQNYTGFLDGESFSGYATSVELDRDARYWSFSAGYEAISPTFRADNGFVRQNNNRRVFLWQGITMYPEKVIPFLERVRPNMVLGNNWNFDGLQKRFFFRPSVNFQFKQQTNLRVNWWYRDEYFSGEQFNAMTGFSGDISSNFSRAINVGLNISIGESIARFLDEPEIGNSLEVNAWGTLRPTNRMSIRPQFSYSRLSDQQTNEEFFSGYIVRTRVKYQFTRHLFLRTVAQYSDFTKTLEIDPLLTYQLNAFTAMHIGSTHDLDQFDSTESLHKYFRQSHRQIFFKFQYFFRR